MGLTIRDDRQMKALTGVSQVHFDFLLSAFSYVYQEAEQKRYEKGVEVGKRSRRPGAGIKGKLPRMADKLEFVLYYYKTYPTFDVLGAHKMMPLSVSIIVVKKKPYPKEYGHLDARQVDCVSGAHL